MTTLIGSTLPSLSWTVVKPAPAESSKRTASCDQKSVATAPERRKFIAPAPCVVATCQTLSAVVLSARTPAHLGESPAICSEILLVRSSMRVAV